VCQTFTPGAEVAEETGGEKRTPARPAMPIVSHCASQVKVIVCLHVSLQQYGMVGRYSRYCMVRL